MRIIIIGNGLSGTIFAKTLRERDEAAEIVFFEEERHRYYPRPNLIEYLAGRLPFDRLFAFDEDWYRERKLELRLGRRVVGIRRGSRQIELDGGETVPYDFLVMANGASAFMPPFGGTDKRGVFCLRTLDDAHDILSYLEGHRRVAVIGGGLLGLEIARGLRSREAEVDVYEFFPRLLPRQLDDHGAAVLKHQIEATGIRVHLDVATQEITGALEARGLRFKDGRERKADLVIVAAGVRPRIELAREAGLEVDRGIVVNDRLQTSDPDIYAAGDCAQHAGRVYGIIPASFQQARAAAHNLSGGELAYEGTVVTNTLKVMGIEVTSVGEVAPEAGTAQEFRREDRNKGLYKKIVLREGRLAGAIWMGTKQGLNEISRLINRKAEVSLSPERLLDDDADFSGL